MPLEIKIYFVNYRRNGMSILLECLTVSAFCLAMASRVIHYAQYDADTSKGAKADKTEIFVLLAMGVGFLVGAVRAAFTASDWLIIFYGLGAMLSYAAVLLAVPMKK